MILIGGMATTKPASAMAVHDRHTAAMTMMEAAAAPMHPTYSQRVRESPSRTANVRLPDVVSVGLRVGELGNTSVRFEVGMYRSDGELFFTGHFVHAFIDRASEETVPIEGERRAKLEGLQVS